MPASVLRVVVNNMEDFLCIIVLVEYLGLRVNFDINMSVPDAIFTNIQYEITT